MKNESPIANSQPPVEFKNLNPRGAATQNPKLKIQNLRGFTLIELLVVISVMAVLVALTIPVIGAFKRKAILNRAQGEMSVLETAIERYKSDLGFYPPDSTNSSLKNQLYYELTSTSFDGIQTYTDQDGGTIDVATLSGAFGVHGFLNCKKPGAEDSTTSRGKNYLNDIHSQIGTGGTVKVLVTAAGGSFPNYAPLSGFTAPDGGNANPWRYNSSNPQNNPSGYDLWLNIVFKPGLTNLICNWNSRPQINTPWQ